MKVHDTAIDGVKIVELVMHKDDRGFFVERFQAEKFAAAGLPTNFVQDNHSRSAPGVLRGLHYQFAPAQGKLVGVTKGRILDVGVDIRPNSKTFGQHVACELSGSNATLLWLPAGIAHGFCVLGDESADVMYKIDAVYGPGGEGGIKFDDPELAIDWPLDAPLISERDTGLMTWKEYCANPIQWDAL